MRRISKVLVIIMCLFLITGCGGMTKNQRNTVIKELKSEKIIDKKWEQIDVYCESTYSAEFRTTSGYGYIYKDENGIMYEIYIASYKKDKENSDIETSVITKSRLSGIDTSVEILDKEKSCPSKCFSYEDETKSEKSKYIVDESTSEKYIFTKTKTKFLFLPVTKYKVEKQ